MQEYFNSKKYIILLLVVFILFTIMTLKVFEYAPKPSNEMEQEIYNPKDYSSEYKEGSAKNAQTTMQDDESDNEESDNDDESNEDEAAKANYDKKHKKGHIDFMPKSYPDINKFDEIPAPKGSSEEEINAENNQDETEESTKE